jgi:lysyl-tRNA synthetase class II
MQSIAPRFSVNSRALSLGAFRPSSLLMLLALTFFLSCLYPVANAAATQKSKSSAATKTPSKVTTAEKTTKVTKPAAAEVPEIFVDTTPEELVDKPQEYLNKNVKLTAKFFAFSSLALDYKAAMRPSKSYLSFLILRSHSHIPLSELKLALPIPKEKDPENQLIAVLKDGDTIEVSGHVFSAALGEPWVDVQHLKKIATADEKTAEGESEDKDKLTEPSSKH